MIELIKGIENTITIITPGEKSWSKGEGKMEKIEKITIGYKYRTQTSETGSALEEFCSQYDAEIAIKEYEERDKKDGIYTPNFYEVAELDENDNWLPCSYLDEHQYEPDKTGDGKNENGKKQ